MCKVRPTIDHDQAPVEWRCHKIRDRLAVDIGTEFTALDGSVEQGMDTRSSSLLHGPDRISQGRLTPNLRMKIAEDAPNESMAKDAADR